MLKKYKTFNNTGNLAMRIFRLFSVKYMKPLGQTILLKVVNDKRAPSRLSGCKRGTPESTKKKTGYDEQMKIPLS